jgi:hypothetical protein
MADADWETTDWDLGHQPTGRGKGQGACRWARESARERARARAS